MAETEVQSFEWVACTTEDFMTWKLECGFDNKDSLGATFKEDKGFKKSGGFQFYTFTLLQVRVGCQVLLFERPPKCLVESVMATLYPQCFFYCLVYFLPIGHLWPFVSDK